MKKFLTLLLSFTLTAGACMLTACEQPSNPDVPPISTGTSEKNEYTITFIQYNQPNVVVKVEEGEDLTEIPKTQPRPGYTVTWPEVDLTNITKNMTVEAIETANSYTITYELNGGEMETTTQTVVYDSPYTLLVPNEREDYEFQGWTHNGTSIESGKTWSVADNVTLVATWKDNRPIYTVTFVDGTTSKEVQVKKGEAVAAEDVPTFIGKDGHTPTWDITDYANIQKDTLVTAIYTPNVYTITYDADGFDIDGTTVQLTYGADCAALDMTLTKDAHKFLGWEYNDITYTNTSKWNVDGNVTLTAKWADGIVITFLDTNGANVTRTAYEGDDLTNIPTPTAKIGYDVDTEWYADKDCTIKASFTNLQADATVYAKATPKNYEITYDANGGILDDTKQSVTFDAEYVLAEPTHEKTYMQFTGWVDASGNFISSGIWENDSNLSLTAQWKDTRAVHTVTFKQSGQNPIEIRVKDGEGISALPALTSKTGYNVSWGVELADLASITESRTITAVEIAKTYTVILKVDANGTLIRNTVEIDYNESYDLSNLAKGNKGYRLVEWQKDGKSFATIGVWDLDVQGVELKAIFEAKTFKIHLDVNGGDALPTDEITFSVTYGGVYELPTPTRAATEDYKYKFQYWKIKGTNTVIANSGTWLEDYEEYEITLIVQWKKIDGWTGNY